MKHFIAIILIFIMLMFETNMELFKNKKCKINANKLDNIQTVIINDTKKKIKTNNQCLCEGFLTKINIWIYNPYELSSRHWDNFYSRKSFNKSSSIINICLKSIIKHSKDKYNIRVFNQSCIKNLIPEFKQHLDNCKNSYSFRNLLKYAILYKYGGIWLPKDTLMLNELNINSNDYYSGKIITFGINNTDQKDNQGISDDIIGSSRNNPFIKNILKFIVNNIYKFQFALKFKDGVNKYFNIVAKKGDYIRYYPLTLQKNLRNKFINESTLMGIFNNNILDYQNKVFLKLNIDNISRLPKFSYLLRMSEKQIMDSNLFITTLIKFSFNKKHNIVHSGTIYPGNI